MVMLHKFLPPVSFIPAFEYTINDYLQFEFKSATLIWIFYIVYYYLMEPVAAVCIYRSLQSRCVLTTSISSCIPLSLPFLS